MGQDATFYVSHLRPGDRISHQIAEGRRAYLFTIDGDLKLNGKSLHKGDSVKITQENELRIESPEKPSEILLIDLP